jgi:hypothetical protein
MKLYHWHHHGLDLFVMADSEDAAVQAVLDSPSGREDNTILAIAARPTTVVGPGELIALGS